MAPLRRGFAVAAAGALLAGCSIQFAASDEYEDSFAPAGATRVVVEGVDGDVVLRGMAVQDVQMRGTRRAVGATRKAARRLLERAELGASYDGGDLVLSFDPPLEYDGLVDLTLDRASTLPSAMGVAIDLDSGDVEISALAGPMDVRTSDGDVDIEDVGPAEIHAAADEGSIRYALTSTDFRVECRVGGGGTVIADASLQALIDGGAVQRAETGDGVVVFTSGAGAKSVTLEASAGDVAVSPLSRSPKMWQ